MAVICPHCSSSDMQAQLNTYQCLNCGRLTSMQKVNEEQQAVLEDNE